MTDGKWQPIETAPKDGSDVILAGKNSRGGPLVGEGYCTLDGIWMWSAGAVAVPTHWRPLPEPPQDDDR